MGWSDAMGTRRRRLRRVLMAATVGLAMVAAELSVTAQSRERIDINLATVNELRELPSIGEVLAQRIVDHRRRHGPFRRPQDLILVRGVSAGLYRQIADLIRAGDRTMKE